jgi:signal peptidase I
MKKKIIIASAVFCALITVIWIVARITGMLLIYPIQNPVNEPNIKSGDRIFSSNLKEPLPYNFIIVTSDYADSVNGAYMEEYKKGSRYLYRLCATAGDVITMKNGVFWVNNKNFDEGLNLNNQYKTSSAEFYLIEEDDINDLDASGGTNMTSGDTVIVTFDSSLIKKYQSKIKLVPFILNDTAGDCFKWYDKNPGWTADNFGPLKIPAGSYFVLGDNRHNALDSRYTGFIKKENIKGVVLNK